MAADTTLAIRLRADGSGQVIAELGKVQGALSKTDQSALGLVSSTGRAAQAFSTFNRIVGGFAAIQAVRLVSNLGQEMLSASMRAEQLNSTLAFATGGTQQAAQASEFLRKTVSSLGLELTSAGTAFGKLAAAAQGTSLAGSGVEEIFTAIAKASTALGLSAAETEGALYAISQMISKGTVAAEELRGQLGERLPGAFQIAARAMGVTTAELGKMLQSGEVVADDFLPRFAREIERSFGQAATRASGSLRAEINRLDTAWEELNRTLGQRFSESAKSAVGWMTKLLEHLNLVAGGVDPLAARLTVIEESLSALSRVEQARSESLISNRYGLFPEYQASVAATLAAKGTPLSDSFGFGSDISTRVTEIRAELLSERTLITELQQAIQQEADLNAGRLKILGENERKVRAGGRDASAEIAAQTEAWSKAVKQLATPAEQYQEALENLRAAAFEVGSGVDLDQLGEMERRLEEQYKRRSGSASAASTASREAAREQERWMDTALESAIEEERALAELEERRTDYLQDLEDQIRLAGLSGRELAVETEALRAQEAGFTGSAEAARELAGRLYDAREASRAAAEQQEATAEVFRRTAERITDAFADTFYEIFRGGEKAFEDLGESIRDLFARTLADLATAAIAQPIIVPIVGTLAGTLGVSQGAQASLTGQLGGTAGTAGGIANTASTLASAASWVGKAATSIGSGAALSGLGTGWGLATTNIGTAGYFGAAGANLGLASSSFSSGAVGTAIGAAAPYLLPAIAAAAVLSKFLGDNEPDNEWFRLVSGTRTGKDARTPLASTSTSFGQVAISGWEDLSGDRQEEFAETLLEQVSEMDAALAAGMTESQVAAAARAVESQALHSGKWEEGDTEGATRLTSMALRNRYQPMVAAAEDMLTASLRVSAEALGLEDAIAAVTLTPEEVAERVAQIGEALKHLNSIATYLSEPTSLPESFATLAGALERQGELVAELARDYDGTLEAAEALSTAVSGRYEMELQYLAKIETISASISESLSDTYESIRLSVYSDQQKYDYARARADELTGELASATDPERIEELVSQISSYAQSAYSVLTPGLQAQENAEFLSFLREIDTLAQARLAAAEGSMQSQAETLREEIREAIERAGVRLESSGATLDSAATRLAEAAERLIVAADRLSAEPRLAWDYA